MRKQVLIVDNDNSQIQRITAILRETSLFLGKGIEIYAVNTLDEAQEVMDTVTVDILILDIVFKERMTQLYPGIEWAEKMRNVGKYVSLPIIFVTNITDLREYAYRELNCLGYLKRDFREEEMIRLLEKAMRHTTLRDGEKLILPKAGGIIYPIKVKDILYIEVLERVLYIYKIDGEVLEIKHKSIRDFKEEVNTPCLIQCNRSMLLNILYVAELNRRNSYVTLTKDEIQLIVGKRYLADVEKALDFKAERFKLEK